MRVTLVLLIVGITLCAATLERKKRSALNQLAKRDAIDLCEETDADGNLPVHINVCDEGRTCIFADWNCDGEADCEDGTDETRPECEMVPIDLCEEIDENGVVPFWMRVCEDQGMCIFEDWVCDNEPDCYDGSDEFDCTDEPPIDLCDYRDSPGSEEWLWECKKGNECILLDWVCDKEEDCKDGSDEKKSKCKDIWDNLTGPYRSGKK